MDLQILKNHIAAYHTHNQTLDAVHYLVDAFSLGHENCEAIKLRSESSSKNLLMTAEGLIGGKQTVYMPSNILDFDLVLVLNMLAHEMLHVRQKAPDNPILDKNEREWQAYYEMLFHPVFPQIPNASVFHRIQFAEKALEYYRRMGEKSDLQTKYKDQKKRVEALYKDLISMKRTNVSTPQPDESSN